MDRKTDYCRKQLILLLGTWKLDESTQKQKTPGKLRYLVDFFLYLVALKIAGTYRYTAFLLLFMVYPCELQNHRGYTDFAWKLWSSESVCSSVHPCFLLQVHQGSSLRILPLWTFHTFHLQSETQHVRTSAL